MSTFQYTYISTFNDVCSGFQLKGRILVASEGINGTLAGFDGSVAMFIEYMQRVDERYHLIDWKFSTGIGDDLPFVDLFISSVNEIVSCGREKDFIKKHVSYDPDSFGGITGGGVHLTPVEFHQQIQSTANPVVIDIRNRFEYDVGHFKDSISVDTNVYSETWKALDSIVSNIDEDEPIYMCCTGGIRCEMASAYLKNKGRSTVYQLQGGIHRYVEAYSGEQSLFKGKNFVFDKRISMPATADIVGKCIECNADFDTYTDSSRCTVCNMPLLMCVSCVAANPYSEYHCRNHLLLKHLYHTDLSPFSVDELVYQKEQLLYLLSKHEHYQTSKCKRKTLSKQIEKINNRIKQINSTN